MISFHWRPLIPGERDAELLWGTIIALTCLFGIGWLCSGIPTPLCLFHAITGIPCPTCGLTRGLQCLFHGDIITAFLFNPLGGVTLLGIALYLLYAVVVVGAKLPRLRWKTLTPKAVTVVRITILLLIAINWIYLIAHERFLSTLP